jgi:outer membrane lipoprotein-sorting protein
MALSAVARRRARYLVPVGAAALTAAIVVIPQAASGATHPNLPARTAAQLLASIERSDLPQFSGTVVETARLGLPSIGDGSLTGSLAPVGQEGLLQVVTLLTGSHTAQLAYGGPDKQRAAIFLSDLSETDIVHNGTDLWTYSSDSNSVTHNTVDAGKEDNSATDETTALSPDKAAERALEEIDPSTAVTVDRTAEVAGRPAYQLDLTPRDPNTLVGSVRIALDSATSMPLRVEVWSRSNSASPAFSVGFTSLSMSAPSASTFDFTKPPTARTESEPFSGLLGSSSNSAGSHREGKGGDSSAILGKDWTSVLVEHLSDKSTAADSSTQPPPESASPDGTQVSPPPAPSLMQELGQLGTAVSGGRIISTTLVTIFLTDDNRVLIGAVTPSYIEQLAASKAAQ